MTSRPPEPRTPSRLFRAEALAEQQDPSLGRVLLTPRIAHSAWVGLTALVVVGVVSLFAFGEYTRKARIVGWLVPERGLIQVVAPQAGVLTQVQVREGAVVSAGAPLAVLSAERRSEAVGATLSEVVRALRARRDSLSAEREHHQALFAQQAATLEARLDLLRTEVHDLARETDLQRERVDLADQVVERQRELRARNIALEESLLDVEGEALDQALALQALERSRTELDRSRLEIAAALDELPLREGLQLAELERAIAALDAELAEAEAAREVVVTAPQDGTVTGLQFASGSNVGTDVPLMTLVPEDSRLEAWLYGPSRAIGFVQPGQRVRMRFEAFPHQKFGQHEGVVLSVSRATVGPGEFAGPMAASSLAASEPVYRVTVELATQAVTTYGEAVALQPGMQLEADVLIDSRRLYQWVLDPLHSLTGRGPDGDAA
jgi:membrane fusion protein